MWLAPALATGVDVDSRQTRGRLAVDSRILVASIIETKRDVAVIYGKFVGIGCDDTPILLWSIILIASALSPEFLIFTSLKILLRLLILDCFFVLLLRPLEGVEFPTSFGVGEGDLIGIPVDHPARELLELRPRIQIFQ